MTTEHDKAITQEEPEEIIFASLWQRIKAQAIDFCVIVVCYGILFLLFKDLLFSVSEKTKSGAISDDIALYVTGICTFFSVLVDLWYFVRVPKKHGATYGKLCVNTRMAMGDRTPITGKAALLRHVPSCLLLSCIFFCAWLFFFMPLEMWMAPIPIYLICIVHGYIFLNIYVMACYHKHQTLSDMLANTSVITLAALKKPIKVEYVDDAKDSKKKSKKKADKENSTPPPETNTAG